MLGLPLTPLTIEHPEELKPPAFLRALGIELQFKVDGLGARACRGPRLTDDREPQTMCIIED